MPVAAFDPKFMKIGVLTAALQDPDAEVRGAAATAIGKVGSTEDGKALISLLSDDSSAVRARMR